MNTDPDLAQRVVIQQSTLPWAAAPGAGVRYRWLEGGAAAAARATAIVQLAPGAKVAHCADRLGEEIVVLDGVLSDAFGSYHKGTYIKNPPGSSHACESASGCILFVKRHHLDAEDDRRIVVDSATMPWYQ
ncbi:MAG: cupin domain-containing protein, partial [Gallionella sp.]